VVNSTPLEKTTFSSSQPVSVLKGTELNLHAQNSLGETLSSEPGISSSYFGPGASRPIIRGLGGDRIRILENGVGTQDASNTSPDHFVAIEPALVDKIEVVRGPATLLYGTSAVGGVVNIFDNRIPDSLTDKPIEGSILLRGETASTERTGLININASEEKIAFHIDAFQSRTDDIDITGYARTPIKRIKEPELEYPEPKGTLPFSSTDTSNLTVGASYIDTQGFIGASVSEMNTNYGVPNGENNISIDGERERLDIRGKLFDPNEFLNSIEANLGVVNYEHTEYESGIAGTLFKNKGFDNRYEFTHDKIAGFEGVVGVQLQKSDFEAIGEEAFQPPSETNTSSAFLYEEYPLNEKLSLQFGGRFDYQDTDAMGYITPGEDISQNISRTFETFSQSGGVIWKPIDSYISALSISHTERAPSAQELYANGPHIATTAFEIGDPELDPERSLGIDLSIRKNEGTIRGTIGIFYNRFNNYIGLFPTKVVEEGLGIYKFESTEADFVGSEAEASYFFFDKKWESFSIDIQPDYVKAKDRVTGDPLPRIPALRTRFGINYNNDSLFNSRLELQHVFDQKRNAVDETETDGYSMLNVYFSKPVVIQSYTAELFIRGTNLLDEKARDHTSFIKDVAPLPGTSFMGGMQVFF